ncbi:hypothetical protein GLOTRDRAFT_50303 [Gloeophyllum trabeum ATCC 11539]|uniref:Polysaccharide lyase 14 domain-containing protein n=1 Tax=Gloeophyllum trabeum (strain ATCC 11539 / FP-39264 / Madison 617) TaxID=670483 RepID=S7RDW2_GLOTA|nr:uncharacterized protein GLOTRDRAFT_50303 [Gloeophyllum trabeum ATCC 11539]EPQ50624.1 hypothetical protein GLOTRDRAFT_50303 [Gloeophyllum trabeum ATCC 11539]
MSYASPSLAPSSTTASLSSSPTPSAALYSWNPPANISDLTPFNITYFPSGQDNLHIVSPSSNQTNSTGVLSISSFTNLNLTDDDSALELFYPAHSINPGNSPQGGAEFYAQPLDLSNASSVTLEYSVFFPDDFDWVKAGKLPGIYGGHTGCSGGDDADDCFSTRLMWREGGLGELYLYAPRDKQAKSVCETPPQSVCDSEYGLSIGRGSFNFTKGNWTHVRQTVTLNTPGMQDGAFVLEVNGQRAINGSEIFYRGFPGSDSNTKGGLLGTFFGGHEPEYATPKDQYTWFKGFNLTIDS